ELPCRLSGTKNHHFAKLRFHDFQRLSITKVSRNGILWMKVFLLLKKCRHRLSNINYYTQLGKWKN
ncbi:hypothetical protein, partial [Bathymodiolus platifrons methanotrophic gill symbiont]|uniref:hypothetical protein n=1 Tax=Bathymodiolus platifrons methanotrophic gill symbiont TaxID=113268 RepID=UPI001B7D7FC3